MAKIAQALGIKDAELYNGAIWQLTNVASQGQDRDPGQLNFAISIVRAIAPRDHLEVLLALQMAAIHLASMRHVRMMNHTQSIPQLDIQERTLRSTGSHIGCMPQFLRFADGVIEWRVLPSDWEHEDSAAEWQVRGLQLSELLPLCGAQLQARGALWLPPEELVRAGQWQGLDAAALQAWSNIE